MPSKNIGNKTIKKVFKYKKKIVVLFADGIRISMDADTFTSFYLYEGKKLSISEYRNLTERILLSEDLNFVKKRLINKRMSEWKVREMLYNKQNLTKPRIDKIISLLKQEHFIDDKQLTKDYLSYYQQKGYGKEKILYLLHQNGLFAYCDKINFSDRDEASKAKQMALKLDIRFRNDFYEKRRSKIYSALLRNGFSSSLALLSLKYIKSDSKRDTDNKLNRDLEKLIRVNIHITDLERKKQKIFRQLINKGYKYDDIISALEVIFNENG